MAAAFANTRLVANDEPLLTGLDIVDGQSYTLDLLNHQSLIELRTAHAKALAYEAYDVTPHSIAQIGNGSTGGIGHIVGHNGTQRTELKVRIRVIQ